MAIKYHPDVNPSADAQNKIKIINEAYHVLGDSERRATYDAERFLNQQSTRPQNHSQTTAPKTETARPTPASAQARPSQNPSQPHREPPQAQYNGFGRVNTQPQSARPNSATFSNDAERRKQHLNAVLDDAKLAFIGMHYLEAERLCREALSVDSRSAIAHELMGDILVRRGYPSKAMTAYSYAIQFNPANLSVQNKLSRLAGVDTSRSHGPTMGMNHRQEQVASLNRFEQDRMLLAVGIVTVLLAMGILTLMYFVPGSPILGPFSLLTPFYLVLFGLASGILLGLYGGLKLIRQELNLKNLRGRPGLLFPALICTSLASFFLSLVVYLVLAFRQEKVSPSVLRVYGTTLMLIILCWLIYHPAGVPWPSVMMMLFSGNFLFPGVMLGWIAADWLRMGNSSLTIS